MPSWYTLMNKNTPVLDILMHETFLPMDVGTLHNLEYANPRFSTGKFEDVLDWWKSRNIPASRLHLKEALQNLGLHTPTELLRKAYGATLSDQYWLKPKDSDLAWENINFFHNAFSDELGEVLVGNINSSLVYATPDSATNGLVPKKWKIHDNGKRYLYKHGTSFRQEPYNEQFASLLCNKLNLEHAVVSLSYDKYLKPVSRTKCFVNDNEEYITAAQLLPTGNLQQYKNLCKEHDLPIDDFLNKLLIIDYIIGNSDRHWGNFGVIRNVETLEWVRLCPAFDFGNSLYYDTRTVDIALSDNDITITTPIYGSPRVDLDAVLDDIEYIDINIDTCLEVFNKSFTGYDELFRTHLLQDVLQYRVQKYNHFFNTPATTFFNSL